jgi:hypothetical protein
MLDGTLAQQDDSPNLPDAADAPSDGALLTADLGEVRERISPSTD